MDKEMEKILVAFDGLEESKKALLIALKLASFFDSHVTILNVAGQSIVPMVPSSISSHVGESQGTIYPLPEHMKDMMVKEAIKILSETKEDIESVWNKLDFAIVFGDPASEIIKEAQKSYDLIVIGYRSVHSPIMSLGNVAEKVVKNASCSVLVIR
ncbi:MAG: universal stress protein [Nitrososphaeria archaeon]